ncbi:MAG: hypothetical protein WCO37_08180 [Bacteroidota bacterium]
MKLNRTNGILSKEKTQLDFFIILLPLLFVSLAFSKSTVDVVLSALQFTLTE